MALNLNDLTINDLQKMSYVVSTAVSTQVAMAVVNPDGSNISAGGGGSSTITNLVGITASGQALSANSLPVVLPASQITTLTPPPAITNYALETGGNLATLAGTVSATKVNVNISSGSIANTSFIATQATGSNLHTVVDSGSITVNTISNFALETGGNLATLAGGVSASVYQVNTKQVNGIAVSTGSGIMGTGVQRVAIASDNDPITVKQATAANLNATVVGTGTFAVQATLAAETTKVIGTVNQGTSPWVISGTVTANAGTNLNTSLLALESGGNLATLAGAITSSVMQVNVKQMNGIATSMGNGTTDTGTQRVTISSDSTGQVKIATGTNNVGNVGGKDTFNAAGPASGLTIGFVGSTATPTAIGADGRVVAPWADRNGRLHITGDLTTNNAAPTGNNVGVLPAIANASAPTYTEGDQVLASVDLSGNTRTIMQGGLMPTGTALIPYQAHITTNTTTTPTSSTAYISSIAISSDVAGTTSTITIQDKQATARILINGFSTTTLTTTPTVVNFQTPIKMVSGIDIITAGAAAATVDVWINYYQ